MQQTFMIIFIAFQKKLFICYYFFQNIIFYFIYIFCFCKLFNNYYEENNFRILQANQNHKQRIIIFSYKYHLIKYSTFFYQSYYYLQYFHHQVIIITMFTIITYYFPNFLFYQLIINFFLLSNSIILDFLFSIKLLNCFHYITSNIFYSINSQNQYLYF
ncbi:hypothetical protein IMG5_061150 [Ichthyophthirius multifiliis]|uniref:Transmembrane protein n=1 Tax=Ichthyophthirius multifiliis TaxID=5932 RepID=G0QNS5_ICHMU|nr:hypothetical protein IMG5_061150 [Ichthyophthirius multifiliis]EGR33116.1 hypothetical protein IMG5_061150 [Ichthyophthirius multifiliis]|eukprot:XP_004037102.1 hypothetical protein IMG5_061150 [Ichthyophthirius multifiliis]